MTGLAGPCQISCLLSNAAGAGEIKTLSSYRFIKKDFMIRLKNIDLFCNTCKKRSCIARLSTYSSYGICTPGRQYSGYMIQKIMPRYLTQACFRFYQLKSKSITLEHKTQDFIYSRTHGNNWLCLRLMFN